MNELALLGLLWVLTQRKQATTSQDSTGTSAGSSTPSGTASSSGGGGAGLVGAGVTALGLGVKIVSGLSGGGAGAAATGATAAGTAATVAAGGLVGAVTVTLLLNPFAWAVYVLIGTIVSRHNELAKNFLDSCRNMAPNARAMHEYERWLWDEWSEHNTVNGYVTRREVRDGRLDKRWREGNGSVTLQGVRTVVQISFNPPPPGNRGQYTQPFSTPADMLAVYRKIRAAALVYLQERARYGYAILSNKPGFPAPSSTQGWGLDEFTLEQRYNINEPGLGGLNQVPLLNGDVEAGSREEPDNPYPPIAQLRGVNTTPDFDGLQVSDLKAARFAALVDAICLFRHDQTIDLRAPGPWSDDLYRWLGQPSGLERSGRTWITDPEVYGERYVLDVWAAKTGQGRIISQ